MKRGDLWWASLRQPRGSEPEYGRPVLIVQADSFNRSRIRTVIAAAVTTNLRLAAAPGNVELRRSEAGVPEPSVVNVSQLITIDTSYLTEHIGALDDARMNQIDEGLKLVLALS